MPLDIVSSLAKQGRIVVKIAQRLITPATQYGPDTQPAYTPIGTTAMIVIEVPLLCCGRPTKRALPTLLF
jgi:hypothetical protein